MYRYEISCPFNLRKSGSTRLIKSQQYLFHQNKGPQNKRSKP
ncbi:unnamed protein product [Arabidopsis halleri]